MKQVIALAFGSNIGDRIVNIKSAIKILSQNGLVVLSESSFYHNKPLLPQNLDNNTRQKFDNMHFVNVVCLFETSLCVMGLFKKIKFVERLIGRKKTPKWYPRKIDIDIILYGKLYIQNDLVTIPHKEHQKRQFVLLPLIEVIKTKHHKALSKNIGYKAYKQVKTFSKHLYI